MNASSNRSVGAVLAAAAAAVGLTAHGSAAPRKEREVVYQTSTIGALLEGVYDGNRTIRQLLQHGDFGLGTFDALDGEMVVLGGKVFQIGFDGRVRRPAPLVKTPFAAVTYFRPDQTLPSGTAASLAELGTRLDMQLETLNVPHAVKISGTFDYVQTRSVPRQQPPYPRLAEVTKNQSVFEFRGVRGTMVGFRFPSYMSGVNVAGYHFHFITADEKGGGHVLDCQVSSVKVELDLTPEFRMELLKTGDFYQLPLRSPDQAEIQQAEQGRAWK